MSPAPYTPVHALVALPLAGGPARRALSPALLLWALPASAIGAMVPDAPLFLDVLWPGTDELAHATHRLLGVVTVDLALAVACTALWVLVVRGPYLAALPRRRPLSPDVSTRAAGPPVIAVAVAGFAVAGTLTHVLWDDFTHLRGTAVQTWDVLRTPVAGVAVYKYLQHGSSFAGFVVLVALVVRWWRASLPVAAPQHLRSAVLSMTAGAVAGMLGAVVRLLATDHAVTVFSLARLAATYPVLGAGLGVVVWAAVRTAASRREARRPVAVGAPGTPQDHGGPTASRA
ncbi:DUF4184 family protein [Oerskovia enterophila]|uniref:DUF4184 family protein n=1 Tax=Oerskovia enterophila TaxID=43678 RepID=A0ABX2Y8C9_9CELL|nr:DUF4184 family protein [Oerskovia enterophila]OCI31944.1 hypothetical protein OERS_12770 [Oerskovia enterophila]